ncbi:MAG: alpha-L-rhamnosidase N-terminal domain-containing protein [Proteiniphilum sp.]
MDIKRSQKNTRSVDRNPVQFKLFRQPVNHCWKAKFTLKFFIVFILIFICTGQIHAINFEGTRWISVDEASVKENQWICFRKNFNLDRKESSAQFYIAVDSKYWLWINGEMVVFEGALKRGPNPTDTYYDKVEVAKYLKKGKNTIAILMWYWGREGFCHKNSGKPGLLAKLVLKNRTIESDETWKAKLHPAYGESAPPYPNPRLPEFNIHFDARNDINGWEQNNYVDTQWSFAQVAGIYPCIPWNKLQERPFPNWYDSGILQYDSISYENDSSNLIITAKLPRNISITPYFKIKSEEGKLIDIRTDNYKGGSEYNVRAEYVTKKGEQEFEAFNYVNGHNVIYTMPKNVEVIALGYRETRYNTKHVGNFKCNDDFYDKLWTKSLNTMNLNMRDAIQDPDRERSQWWGDAVTVASEIYYSCDSDGLKIINKAIKNLVDWQKPDGILYSPVPTGKCYKELPAQMLASIGKFGFWNYYLYTGDKETIRYVYPAVKKYLSLWGFDDQGLVIHRKGDWDWYDWGNNIDIPVMENAWYSLALESAYNMALLLDYPDDASVYAQKKEVIKKGVNSLLWNGREYRSQTYKGNTDDRANGLAVLAGFADKEKWQSVRHFLNGYANAGPYMEKYILESFFQQGDAKSGLDRMKRRYEYMVNSKLTTLWEDWSVGGSGGGSINHGWAGGPLIILSQYVAGVQPIDAGWKSFIVKPQLGDLEWVDCTVPAGDKTINVQINKTSHVFEINIENTLKCKYIVGIPKITNTNKILINDQEYDQSVIEALSEKNISFHRADSDYWYVNTNFQKLKIVIK